MEEIEEPLSGGNVATSVVRIGATVRKPATAATPAIEHLLLHLQSVGFPAAPRSFGCDNKGRQILEYIPGAPCHPGPLMSVEDLQRVGSIIRDLHDALSGFKPLPSAVWNVVMPADRPFAGEELICHNDLAPWNLVCDGDRWVFIDWDGAAPGTRLWDLAYAAVTFPPVEPGCNLQETATRLRAILDGYGLDRSSHDELLRLMVRRARAMYELLLSGDKTGRQPWARLYAEGHGEYWSGTADYTERNLASLSVLLS